MKTVFKCLSLLAIVNFLSSCGNNRFDIDTSKVSVEPVVFKRLDKDVFSLNASNISNQTVELQRILLSDIPKKSIPIGTDWGRQGFRILYILSHY